MERVCKHRYCRCKCAARQMSDSHAKCGRAGLQFCMRTIRAAAAERDLSACEVRPPKRPGAVDRPQPEERRHRRIAAMATHSPHGREGDPAGASALKVNATQRYRSSMKFVFWRPDWPHFRFQSRLFRYFFTAVRFLSSQMNILILFNCCIASIFIFDRTRSTGSY